MLGISISFFEIKFVDVVDVFFVTLLLYNLYKLIRGSVALRVFVGFLSLYLTYLVVKATEMGLLTEILGQFMNVGVLAAIILFQQEIRKFLLLIGKSTSFENLFSRYFNFGKNYKKDEFNISPIIEAMKSLGGTNTGALIVISNTDDLKFYADTGDSLDAQVSKRLLLSIFYKNSPLHDGAVIIHKSRISAARCILPVSDNPDIPPTLGLRHRASIGITEVTNAAVLVVSEETGQLSFVKAGEIFHGLSVVEIRKMLNAHLLGMSLEESAREKAKKRSSKKEEKNVSA